MITEEQKNGKEAKEIMEKLYRILENLQKLLDSRVKEEIMHPFRLFFHNLQLALNFRHSDVTLEEIHALFRLITHALKCRRKSFFFFVDLYDGQREALKASYQKIYKQEIEGKIKIPPCLYTIQQQIEEMYNKCPTHYLMNYYNEVSDSIKKELQEWGVQIRENAKGEIGHLAEKQIAKIITGEELDILMPIGGSYFPHPIQNASILKEKNHDN